MTRRRFYAPPAAFAADGASLRLAPEETRHLRAALRLRPGDEVYVFDGEGREYLCAVADLAGKREAEALLEVRERVAPARAESPLRLTLAVALLKGEKFDLVIQKATELGVARITPVTTARADVRLRDEQDAAQRASRWQRLALEAAKQSGRARLPAIERPVGFDSLLASAPEELGWRLLFAERAGRGLRETLRESSAGQISEACALVGPEGGWEDEEIERARAARWSIVTLGGRTLRAETAAIVVAALLQHLLGDLD